jgi:ATP-binding cassette subfamily F protein 3
LLLLDEPTTHLDIPSQEILQEVLADYQGTMLLVSHDRYLIDALATRIWEIQPGQSRSGQSLPGQPRLQVFEGSYSQYRAYLEEREIEHSGLEEIKSKKAVASKTRRTSATKLERRRRARLEEIEGLVETLEQQLEVLSRKLENPPVHLAELQKLGVEYVQVQSELDELMSEWEQLNHNIT